MAPSPSQLTPAQLEIMNLIWIEKECTVSFLWEELRKKREVARNTILTLVQRLEQRGFLTREQRGRSFVYRSQVTREVTRKQRLKDLLDHAFAGSAENLVKSLLGNGFVSAEEISRLRKALTDEEKRLKPRKNSPRKES